MPKIRDLKLGDGAYYGEGPDGKRVCRGARMGRRDILPDDHEEPVRLRIRALKLVDGCYDEGGAYWGGPTLENRAWMYCAWGDSEEVQVQVFVRAISRKQAKEKVREELPNAKFVN